MEKEIKILVDMPEEVKKELEFIREECFPDKTEEELCRLALRQGLDSNRKVGKGCNPGK